MKSSVHVIRDGRDVDGLSTHRSIGTWADEDESVSRVGVLDDSTEISGVTEEIETHSVSWFNLDKSGSALFPK
jgi:hypothetical protein